MKLDLVFTIPFMVKNLPKINSKYIKDYLNINLYMTLEDNEIAWKKHE